MSFGGVLTGEVTGLPWALVNVLPFNQTVSGPPFGLGVSPAHGTLGRARDRLLWLAYGAVTTPVKRTYDRARLEVGLPVSRVPYGTDLMSPWLVLATGCPVSARPRIGCWRRSTMSVDSHPPVACRPPPANQPRWRSDHWSW